MTPDEFRLLLHQKADNELLDPCLRDDAPPFVFESNSIAWHAFRQGLANGLGVKADDIRVVGSGRFGFSLRPHGNLKEFSDKSDIDVAVINAEAFDRLWYALLRAVYPRSPFIDTLPNRWLDDKRKGIYTGFLQPRQIRIDRKIFGTKAQGIVDISRQWFAALQEAGKHPPRRHERVAGRLYRTWTHAELYHLHSLRALRPTLPLL